MHRFVFSIFLCSAAIAPFLNCGVLADVVTCSGIVPMTYRNDKISITDFGGVGDGVTMNTKAFRAAIYRIEHLRRRGRTLLYIPPGEYLTESFNLTGHMTLYLARGAVIKATQDTRYWPLIAPLPSYGRGRERPGGRYISFIHGDGLHDVIITGENGTIDGQGSVWWNMWRQRTLQFTRPHLIEFMNSKNIIISNVIFKNSPFWNIHPVYCSNVVIQYLTILAPPDSPNTDGIDPGDFGDHPDDKFDPNALPVVKDVTIKNVWGENVQQPGSIHGLSNSPFTGICLSNINIHGGTTGWRKTPWQCSDVSGGAVEVSPWPCSELTSTHQTGACSIPF
ncbi:putative polygalacturonase [Camellia lanceoleosa]|uniref:Polygalacturonase n=1 Tax=Camellia lanceoleosa TaxID=1840588 RepID=A0ACC0FMM9_9ERIC|nr:putative polygalacturonase [Camellia lanceoleosa]